MPVCYPCSLLRLKLIDMLLSGIVGLGKDASGERIRS